MVGTTRIGRDARTSSADVGDRSDGAEDGYGHSDSQSDRFGHRCCARVDRALKDDLGRPEGPAAENVYMLDPCCGIGAYPAEVLRRIAVDLEGQGLGALAGVRGKQAATERGSASKSCPLQVRLTMQNLDARLAEAGTELAGVFLTNALTGWEPRTTKPLPFLELEEERDRAKQETPILVILGSPPYNGYPGVAVDEERELTEAYRTTRQAHGIERSLCPILPHGRTAHCGEDRAGCGLLHLQRIFQLPA